MPITVFSGRPGSGKTTKLAQTLVEIVTRNNRYYEKTGVVRPIWTNFNLNPELEELYSGGIRHWEDLSQLEKIKDGDVFIDEIANYFDAKHWAELNLSTKRWLQQHRKLGVEIYGNAQDFAQVDIAFRRMTSDLFYLVKIISSRDPSPTKPPVKHIWGLSVIYRMSPVDYKEDQKENKTSFDNLLLITRAKCDIFDTRQEIKAGQYPPLHHHERYCIDPNCKFKRVIHN